MELKNTVDQMLSSDYRDRFKAEYNQLECRLNKLMTMLEKWNRGELDFTPICPKELLEEQAEIMAKYLEILANRAALEGITL